MKKILLVLFIMAITFLATINAVQAQDSLNEPPKYKYGIGAGAGFATGYGLSFRYVPKKFGAQVNFAPYKSEETERYSFGVTLLYMLVESRVTNLFVYQANHFFYNSYTQYNYNPNPPFDQTKSRHTERYVNNGLGFGIEIIMAKRIGLNLMAGYAFYDNFRKINVTGEAALYYKF